MEILVKTEDESRSLGKEKFMPKFRRFRWLTLVAAFGIGASTSIADPISTFGANLTVTVMFPVPVANMLDVTTPDPTDAFLPAATELASGNAGVTQAVNPTSVFAGNMLTFTAGPIAGFAGPGVGTASAVSYGTSQTVNLNNLTMDALTVQLSGTYTYSLAATAGPGGAAGAAFSFQIDNNTNPTTVVLFGPQQNGVVAPPDSTAMCNNCAIAAFDVALPPGVTSINIDPFVSGEATSVPEPSTIVLVLSVPAVICLMKKTGAATHTVAKEEEKHA